MSLTRRAVYFLHIPKTAGSSVDRWLRERFGPDGVCTAKIWDQIVDLKQNDLQQFSVFSGHFGVDLEEFLGKKLATVSVFRDPLSRTVSHYRHVFRDTNHPHNRRVSRQSFADFVRDHDNWSMIENFQARYLVRSSIMFTQYVRRLDRSEWKGSRLSVASEDARYLFDKVFVRERSLETLSSLDLIGVTDELQGFLDNLAKMIWPHLSSAPGEAPLENVAPPSSKPDNISRDMVDLVHNLTTIDAELYSAAKKASSANFGGGCDHDYSRGSRPGRPVGHHDQGRIGE